MTQNTPNGILHLRGEFPKFLCGETFRAEYTLNGDVSQVHTDRRDKSTCEECNTIYDEMVKESDRMYSQGK